MQMLSMHFSIETFPPETANASVKEPVAFKMTLHTLTQINEERMGVVTEIRL